MFILTFTYSSRFDMVRALKDVMKTTLHKTCEAADNGVIVDTDQLYAFLMDLNFAVDNRHNERVVNMLVPGDIPTKLTYNVSIDTYHPKPMPVRLGA